VSVDTSVSPSKCVSVACVQLSLLGTHCWSGISCLMRSLGIASVIVVFCVEVREKDWHWTRSWSQQCQHQMLSSRWSHSSQRYVAHCCAHFDALFTHWRI